MGVKKAKTKKSKTSKVKTVASKVKSAITGTTSKGVSGRHKKSALWYLKQIQRLKAKRRYEKERMRL